MPATGSSALARAATPHPRRQDGGRYIQIASVGGQVAFPAMSLYHATKDAPDLNPVEGICSVLRRGCLSNAACATTEHRDQRIRRGLRLVQYRSHLMEGCFAETGLTIGSA